MGQDGQDVKDLIEAKKIQDDDVKEYRLTLECAQAALGNMLDEWRRLEAYENLAYEEKIARQLITLNHATSSLWYLQRGLVDARRKLQKHFDQLRAAH